MASKNHSDLDVSTDTASPLGSAVSMADRRTRYAPDCSTPTPSSGTLPAVEVLFLKAYIAELECELAQREKHNEEITERYETLLDEQHRAYHTWIHELEGEGCTCQTSNPPSQHHRENTGLAGKLLNKLFCWRNSIHRLLLFQDR